MKISSGAKRLVIYEDKKSKAIFLRPSKWNPITERHALKHHSNGKALSKAQVVSNAELGKLVKQYLRRCD